MTIDYIKLHEQCRKEGKDTLDIDDVSAGHPVAEAELAELRAELDDAVRAWALLRNENRELNRQNDRMAAKVVRLQTSVCDQLLELARCGIGANYGGEELYWETEAKILSPVEQALQESSTASLAIIQAKAIEYLAHKCRMKVGRMMSEDQPFTAWEERSEWLELEAQRIRQSANQAGGEE